MQLVWVVSGFEIQIEENEKVVYSIVLCLQKLGWVELEVYKVSVKRCF